MKRQQYITCQISTWWSRKKSVVRFHGFLPKTMTSLDCGSYFWLKRFTKVNTDQISGLTKQSFWNKQFIDHVKMHFFWYFLIKLVMHSIAVSHPYIYICLIFVNRKKETVVKIIVLFLLYRRWPFSSDLFHHLYRLKYDMK